MFSRPTLSIGTLCFALVSLLPVASADNVCSCKYYQGGVCYDMSCYDTNDDAYHGSYDDNTYYRPVAPYYVPVQNYTSRTSRASFSVTVTATHTTVRPGDMVNFTIRVRNLSSYDDTTDVMAELESGLRFETASKNGVSSSDNSVRWRNVFVDGRDTVTLSLRTRVESYARNNDLLRVRVTTSGGGSSSVSLRFEGDSYDCNDYYPYTAYDPYDVPYDYRSCGYSPYTRGSVTLDITDDRDPVRPGDTLTYKILLTNRSSYTSAVDVRAVLDPDTVYDSATGNGRSIGSGRVEWRSVVLDRNETRTLTVRARVRSDAVLKSSLRFTADAGADADTETTRVDGYGTSASTYDSDRCSAYNSYYDRNSSDARYCSRWSRRSSLR